MKKKTVRTTMIAAHALVFLLMTLLIGCGKKTEPAEPARALTTAPVSSTEAAVTAESEESAESAKPAESDVTVESVNPAESPESEETETEPARQDGERFDGVIMIEGMEETVHYEHIRNDALGFEMDYDYESFVRRTEPDRECFISVYDDPGDPQNYLEVTYSADDAETVCTSVSAALSNDYELIRESCTLDRAGSSIRIDASEAKGSGVTPEQLQTVYIIPAPDGCRVAAAHCSFESAEGFGRRFSDLMNTLTVIERTEGIPLSEGESISDEQALQAVMNYCAAGNPDLEDIIKSGEYPAYFDVSSSDEHEIVVLFRSYTGALLRYYIDPVSGDTYVTEFVPGITPEEERTDESFNVRDYL